MSSPTLGSLYSVLSSPSSESGSELPRRHPHQHSRPTAPPRLSSPRAFSGFFSSIPESASSRRDILLPPLPSSRRRAGEYSFPDAIQRTSRAVTNAGEAFQRRSQSSPVTSEVVDLTDSPLAENEAGEGRRSSRERSHSHFITTTTHPHDSRQTIRGLSTLHQPIFGYQPLFTPGPPVPLPGDNYSDSLARARSRRNRMPELIETSRGRPRTNLQHQINDQVEREAIRRQQDNHRAWQRTRERTRHIQEILEPDQTPSVSSSQQSTPADSIFGSSRNSSPATMPSTEKIEAVDLTAIDDNQALAETLAKQRADAIAAQKPNTSTEAGRTTFTAYKCPICMDTLKNATTTTCGHLFCHQCIIDTLNWSAAQQRQEAARPRNVKGVCPVCRKPLKASDAPGQGRNLVPIEMKLLTNLKRKRDEKGKGKADDVVSTGKPKAKKAKRETSEEFFGWYTNQED